MKPATRKMNGQMVLFLGGPLHGQTKYIGERMAYRARAKDTLAGEDLTEHEYLILKVASHHGVGRIGVRKEDEEGALTRWPEEIGEFLYRSV